MNRILSALITLTLTSPAVLAADCDRVCLSDMITRYAEALVARDPGRLPLAEGVRFTEDSAELELGQGLWQTVTGWGRFRQDYLDVARQIAASHFVVLEGDAQVLYSVVLRIVDEKIAGIESLVQRVTPDSRFQPTMLGAPLVGMSNAPSGPPMSRAGMIETALYYTEGLRIGSFVDARTPFADEAYRVENGSYMAGIAHCPREECPDILTQNIIEHPDVTASVAAVDEDAGIVLLWMNFGDTNSYGPGNALVTFEAFKVYDEQIHVVQAFFRILPKETQRGWPSAN